MKPEKKNKGRQKDPRSGATKRAQGQAAKAPTPGSDAALPRRKPPLVRVARSEDRDALVEIVLEMDAADGAARQRYLEDAPVGAALRAVYPPVLLAFVDDQLAGVLLFHRVQPALLQPGSLFVDDLYVRPRFRRAGVGAALVDEVRRIAAREDRVQVDLLARKGNIDGFAFYERLGAVRFDDVEAVRFQVTPTGRQVGA